MCLVPYCKKQHKTHFCCGCNKDNSDHRWMNCKINPFVQIGTCDKSKDSFSSSANTTCCKYHGYIGTGNLLQYIESFKKYKRTN